MEESTPRLTRRGTTHLYPNRLLTGEKKKGCFIPGKLDLRWSIMAETKLDIETESDRTVHSGCFERELRFYVRAALHSAHAQILRR